MESPIDTDDNRRRTPLNHAAACGNVSICEMLLQKGANVNSIDIENNTPLHEAARAIGAATRGDHDGVCRLLIRYGAKTESVNMIGHTPLHVAACEGIEKTAIALIQAGANPYAKAGKLSAAGLAGQRNRKGMASQIKGITHSMEAARAIDKVLCSTNLRQ